MPIVLSKEELARITRWTDPGRDEAEVARRREYVRYLDETSRNMTKSWPNSLENVNRRNEELRLARAQAAERTNTEFYSRYVRKQRERQSRLMASARDIVFRNKDAPKMLLSAVIETCVLKERSEQLKFLNQRRQEAAEKKRQEDEDIIRKAKEWEELNARRRRMRFQVDKNNQQAVLEQAHEVAERNRTEYETELKMQQLDNLHAAQQMDAIKEFETNFKAAEKARILSDMEKARQEAEARRCEVQARSDMDDRLIEVLQRSKARVEKMRVQTNNNIKAAKQKILDNISSKLESGDAAIAAKEQAMLEKAIQEKEEKEAKRRQKQQARLENSRRERAAEHERALREEARRARDCATALQWDCMNRFKNLEIYEEFQEKLREEKARKIQEYKEEILRLWKERSDRESRERAETRHFHGEMAERRARAADGALLAHARALVAEARARGRPTRPLLKAIDSYCKLYRLYPMPGLPSSLQEHFEPYAPRDGTQQGPEPEPEAGAKDEAGAKARDAGERNGLQDPVLPSTSKKSENGTAKESTDEDYKRVGRANGLQRRNAETDLTLPSITAVPCKTEACSCILKK